MVTITKVLKMEHRFSLCFVSSRENVRAVFHAVIATNMLASVSGAGIMKENTYESVSGLLLNVHVHVCVRSAGRGNI